MRKKFRIHSTEVLQFKFSIFAGREGGQAKRNEVELSAPPLKLQTYSHSKKFCKIRTAESLVTGFHGWGGILRNVPYFRRQFT